MFFQNNIRSDRYQVMCSGSKQETEIRKSQKLTLYPLKQCYYLGFVCCYIKPMST